MMMCVGALINPFKDNLESKYQLFPTINMACRESILAWFNLRNCVMDFGKKYMQRILVYSSVFLGMYLFYAVILLLSFFNIISFEFSPVFNLICIYDIVIILGIILSMFHYGAYINNQFLEHKL